jgi:signal peptidase I
LIGWRPALATAQDLPGLPPFAVEEEAPSRGQLAKEIPLLIALAILIAFLVKTFVAQAFYIPSGSMIPQLNIGDRVVVSKLSYDLHDPNRGDIIVFDAPPRAPGVTTKSKGTGLGRVVRDVFESIGVLQPSTEEYIKRVIALPGETVQGKDGHVFINGQELVEPYLPPGTLTSDFGPVTVPKGGLWVMGDNRSNSSDSRVFGTIRRRTVVGRAIMRVWPAGRAAFL